MNEPPRNTRDQTVSRPLASRYRNHVSAARKMRETPKFFSRILACGEDRIKGLRVEIFGKSPGDTNPIVVNRDGRMVEVTVSRTAGGGADAERATPQHTRPVGTARCIANGLHVLTAIKVLAPFLDIAQQIHQPDVQSIKRACRWIGMFGRRNGRFADVPIRIAFLRVELPVPPIIGIPECAVLGRIFPFILPR